MRQLCHLAVSNAMYSRGDIAFCEGEVPVCPQMLISLSGRMQYVRGYAPPEELREMQPVSEATLWTRWVHRGTLRMVTVCDMMALDAQKFQTIATQLRCHGSFPPEAYARDFVELLSSSGHEVISDLVGTDRVRDLAARAFGT